MKTEKGIVPAARAALYIRVSTEEQAVHGLSIEAQREALDAWAETAGVQVAGHYIDAGRFGMNFIARFLDSLRSRNYRELACTKEGSDGKMERITEVAKYFLAKESMTHKKLQKMCYFAQAWYLANYGIPLFQNNFEAWVHGPVSPDLYYIYREWGWLPISQPKEGGQLSDPKICEFLDLVYKTYGSYSADQLENITHQESPWLNARRGYSAGEYCRNIISTDEMRKYYGSRLGK